MLSKHRSTRCKRRSFFSSSSPAPICSSHTNLSNLDFFVQSTVLTVSPKPHLLGDFWSYITEHDVAFSTPEAQTRLSDRLRDTLLKQITLIGAPQVLSALIPLAKLQTGGKGAEERGELDLEPW